MICTSSINLSEPKSETMFLVYMFYVRFALKHSLGFGQMAPHQESWLCWLCLEKKDGKDVGVWDLAWSVWEHGLQGFGNLACKGLGTWLARVLDNCAFDSCHLCICSQA